jgi:hypothetical protein
MTSGDYPIAIVVAGVLAIVAIVLVSLGREAKRYYHSLVTLRDAGDFPGHWPRRPRLGALRCLLAPGLKTSA